MNSIPNNHKKHYLEELIQYRKQCRENSLYSQKRIDIVLLTISPATIILILNLISENKAWNYLLFVSIVGFTITIILNFIGLYLSSLSNTYGEKDATLIIEKITYQDEFPREDEKTSFEKEADKYDKMYGRVSIISFLIFATSMIFGITGFFYLVV
ncbi:hypothetical protein [Ekhidna sp.]|uniref:hypothetical protein n=1 Tax=Ekhidna sp. TaxID=2608089 RepID=UPI003517CB94